VPELCAKFHRASELIGRKWTGAIIFVLLRARCRFATLREAIPEITDRMLSERLQELEQEQILERIVIPEMPVRVEYALTEKGQALAKAIDAIGKWAEEWGAAAPQGASRSAPGALGSGPPRAAGAAEAAPSEASRRVATNTGRRSRECATPMRLDRRSVEHGGCARPPHRRSRRR
jgi:DNA-binding HxlR family transcriptional regulator